MTRTLGIMQRLAFALDVEGDKVIPTLRQYAGYVGWIKANRAIISQGPLLTQHVINTGTSFFLDLKCHDIPSTVRGYAHDYDKIGGIGMFNVHALGGRDMMTQTAQELDSLYKGRTDRPLLLAVTILTSHDQAGYEELGFTDTIREGVLRLAKLAKASGCDGVVASPHENAMIKSELGEKFLVVNPGIRFEEEFGTPTMGDQKRAATPFNAIADGADILVMGTSLLKGGLEAVARAYDEIEQGLAARQLRQQNCAS